MPPGEGNREGWGRGSDRDAGRRCEPHRPTATCRLHPPPWPPPWPRPHAPTRHETHGHLSPLSPPPRAPHKTHGHLPAPSPPSPPQKTLPPPGVRTVDSLYKLKIFIQIAMLYLEDDDPVSAETFIKKASSLIAGAKDAELELQYKTSYARIMDAKRRCAHAQIVEGPGWLVCGWQVCAVRGVSMSLLGVYTRTHKGRETQVRACTKECGGRGRGWCDRSCGCQVRAARLCCLGGVTEHMRDAKHRCVQAQKSVEVRGSWFGLTGLVGACSSLVCGSAMCVLHRCRHSCPPPRCAHTGLLTPPHATMS